MIDNIDKLKNELDALRKELEVSKRYSTWSADYIRDKIDHIERILNSYSNEKTN